LKEVLRGIVPDEVMDRPKMGFGVPLHEWFRNELKTYSYDTLLSEKSIGRKIFKREALQKFLDSHDRIDQGYRIWALLTLELWFQEYFD
jgi:asparagine synthase (glutamine-hydrolysing)